MPQLLPIDLVAPGFRGVNFEESQGILEPPWATKAENCVIDSQGRLASRRGYSDITTTAITATPNIETLFEYLREAGTSEYIVAWDGGISNSISNPEGSDISGSVTDTSGTWWFQNYNDKCLGFQDGQKPIVYNGSGNFATVVEGSGTAPTIAGGVGLCAYGRVWGLDADQQVIKFTGLLDETNWGGSGAGSIDMQNIWTQGTDRVKAIIAFNGALVVFGEKHIVTWNDGVGSQLGLNPDNMYVSDVLAGTGTISQWSIQPIGEADVLYASRQGLQSLSRVLQAGGSIAINTLTRKVQGDFLAKVESTTDLTEIRSVIDSTKGFYIISFPTAGRSYVFFYNKPFLTEAREQLFPITTWTLAPTAWLRDTANKRLILGYAGNVGLYAGADTDAGTTFSMTYESPWLDLGEDVANRLKILKRIGSIVFVQSATTLYFKWDFDFKGNFVSKSKTFGAGSGSEWGVAEWGLAEWSGGLSLRIAKFPASGSGQYIKLGVSADVASQIALQQLELFSKLGRIA